MTSKNNVIRPRKSNIIFDAMQFAMQAHTGHFRKSTKIPYILHPLGVAKTLIEYGFPDEVVVAGVLHDTLEDTPVTLSQISQKFGEKVAKLVQEVSEPDKSDTWENRKRHTIEYLKKAPLDVLYISCADKLDNIRSMVWDYERIGEKLFARFNRPKAQQRWYYTSLSKVYLSRAGRTNGAALFREFDTEVKQLFP